MTAELNQPDGRVWATVVAKTGGLSISSAYGHTDCDPARALVQYHPGVLDKNACTVVFGHASTALPVSASTAWDATWTGSGGTGGALPGLAQFTNLNVPVDEVQNIATVTR